MVLADAIKTIRSKKVDLLADNTFNGTYVKKAAILKTMYLEEELNAKQKLIAFISARYIEFHVVDVKFKPNNGNRGGQGKEKELLQAIRDMVHIVIDGVQYVDHQETRKLARVIWGSDSFKEDWWNVMIKVFRGSWNLEKKQIVKNVHSKKTPLVYFATLLVLLDLGMIPRNPKKEAIPVLTHVPTDFTPVENMVLHNRVTAPPLAVSGSITFVGEKRKIGEYNIDDLPPKKKYSWRSEK